MSAAEPVPLVVRHFPMVGASVFRLSGELDLLAVPELEHRIAGPPRDGVPLVLDTRDLDFIDSSGLRSILQLARELRGQGVSLVVLVSDTGPVKTVMDLVGAWDALDVRATLSDVI
ncbi:MAG TPA: STAS domain-containing protein [Miltoncostaeaceae bacterium]|nr:STAS domain-containing protein [Miltoncostaeaceae bacterium]